MLRKHRLAGFLLAGVAVAGPLANLAPAQTRLQQPEPGFNLFTVEQDIELGRQSAIEAEKQLRLLGDRNTNTYLNRIIQRLASGAPGARYPYSIKAVNASEINAFSLPGGPMYVNRGLLTSVRNEAELAGVLSHEMAHVAMRHGTHQASKAYLTRSGLGILGGLLGKSSTGSVLNAIGGVGLNALFLKFSRDDEYEADQVGVQIMANAGYNPAAMADFFALMRAEQGRDPSKIEQFLSDHPSAANRESRIRELAANTRGGTTEVVGGFSNIKSRLGGMPAASSQRVTLAQGEPSAPTIGRVPVQIVEPSGTFVRFAHSSGFFTIDHPNNWNTFGSGIAVSMAPSGGVVQASNGQSVMVYGVIINHYAPFEGEESRRSQSLQRNYAPFEDRSLPRGSLEDATDDLVRTILDANTYLRTETGSAQSEVIDGAAGFSVVLSGTSPATGMEERVTVYTRGLTDGHVLYALGITPGPNAGSFDPVFRRMMRTLNVNDQAAHRSTRISGQ
ncbi:MAG TPA: M48 family metallopeptidase [Gemmatimonadales bacterium]|nr:M48 family metallopeptidase [Gemmatimonadales bacterium]